MLTSSPCNGFVVRLPTFQRGYASAEVESRVPCRTARRCGQLLAKAISPRTQGEYAAQPQKCSSSLYRLLANSLNVSSDYLIGRIDTPVPESTVVGNLISELTTEEVIYLVSILSRYVEILKKAGTDRNENSSV